VQPKQAAHARSAKVKPLHATLARRALLRLASMAAPDPHSLGVPRPQFPRLLSSLPASLCSSNDFEIGSTHLELEAALDPLEDQSYYFSSVRSTHDGHEARLLSPRDKNHLLRARSGNCGKSGGMRRKCS